MKGVDDVVDELKAETRAALRHKAAFEKHLARIYELLPDAPSRKGPTEIEGIVQRLVPRGHDQPCDRASHRHVAQEG